MAYPGSVTNLEDLLFAKILNRLEQWRLLNAVLHHYISGLAV